MGRRLKLQSEDIVRVSTAGEPGVRGYSFLARLRISQPKEMAIEESMHLQEREVIRGGWYSCRYTSNIETDRSPYVCERSFHVPGYRFSYDQNNSSIVILYSTSDIKEFRVSLASGQLKIEVPVREESISHFEITCFPFVRRRRGFRRGTGVTPPLRFTQQNALSVWCVPSVDAFHKLFRPFCGWSGLHSSDSTENPQNCSYQKSMTSYILWARDVQYLRE